MWGARDASPNTAQPLPQDISVQHMCESHGHLTTQRRSTKLQPEGKKEGFLEEESARLKEVYNLTRNRLMHAEFSGQSPDAGGQKATLDPWEGDG